MKPKDHIFHMERSVGAEIWSAHNKSVDHSSPEKSNWNITNSNNHGTDSNTTLEDDKKTTCDIKNGHGTSQSLASCGIEIMEHSHSGRDTSRHEVR